MQVPKRKKETDRHLLRKDDPMMTKTAYQSMVSTIERLKKDRPKMVSEVTRTAAMGDLSENAAYTEAKYALRRLDGRIFSLEQKLAHAVVIEPKESDGQIEIGSVVVVLVAGKEKTFQILGELESNPLKGIISYSSPLGKLLIGKCEGDSVELTTPTGSVSYKVISLK